jgi:hypothetical protein
MMIVVIAIVPSALVILCGVGMSQAAAISDEAAEESFRGLMLRAFGRRAGNRRSRAERRTEPRPVEQERRADERRSGERRSDPTVVDRYS